MNHTWKEFRISQLATKALPIHEQDVVGLNEQISHKVYLSATGCRNKDTKLGVPNFNRPNNLAT